MTNLECEVSREETSITNVMSLALKMLVSIEFLGRQRAVTKTDSIDMPITEETRVTDAIEYVRHQYPDLCLDEGMVLITVNQEMASLDTVLNANDTLSFLPLIAGG
ncbi:MoaD/ThiS family protein [Chloroflexota bacterium]